MILHHKGSLLIRDGVKYVITDDVGEDDAVAILIPIDSSRWTPESSWDGQAIEVDLIDLHEYEETAVVLAEDTLDALMDEAARAFNEPEE